MLSTIIVTMVRAMVLAVALSMAVAVAEAVVRPLLLGTLAGICRSVGAEPRAHAARPAPARSTEPAGRVPFPGAPLPPPRLFARGRGVRCCVEIRRRATRVRVHSAYYPSYPRRTQKEQHWLD